MLSSEYGELDPAQTTDYISVTSNCEDPAKVAVVAPKDEVIDFC